MNPPVALHNINKFYLFLSKFVYYVIAIKFSKWKLRFSCNNNTTSSAEKKSNFTFVEKCLLIFYVLKTVFPSRTYIYSGVFVLLENGARGSVEINMGRHSRHVANASRWRQAPGTETLGALMKTSFLALSYIRLLCPFVIV